MSDSSWSNNPYAPQMPFSFYMAEKTTFIGVLMGLALYGVAVGLFFPCMNALLNPVDRTQGIKWGLVAHTSAMFTFLTINSLMNLAYQSVAYVDNRAFPGIEGVLPPGPVAWRMVIEYSNVNNALPDVLFFLNTWLADGLLLYRCYVIYSMKKRIILLPFLVYLTSLAMGIMFSYQISTQGSSGVFSFGINFGLLYFSVTLSLNILLTLMIVSRLTWHSWTVWKAMGDASQVNGLYKTVITMIIESFALYTITYVAFLVLWGAMTNAPNLFAASLSSIQVIAPFLLVLRVANRTAMESSTMSPGTNPSVRFASRGKSTRSDQTSGSYYPMSSMGSHGKISEDS